jgi:acylphosphatase
MPEEVVRVRVRVRGRVQMVGYRAFALHHAQRLGLRGTIANLPDGAVECVVEGPERVVNAFLDKVRVGPYHARVDHVEVSREPVQGALPPITVTA